MTVLKRPNPKDDSAQRSDSQTKAGLVRFSVVTFAFDGAAHRAVASGMA